MHTITFCQNVHTNDCGHWHNIFFFIPLYHIATSLSHSSQNLSPEGDAVDGEYSRDLWVLSKLIIALNLQSVRLRTQRDVAKATRWRLPAVARMLHWSRGFCNRDAVNIRHGHVVVVHQGDRKTEVPTRGLLETDVL